MSSLITEFQVIAVSELKESQWKIPSFRREEENDPVTVLLWGVDKIVSFFSVCFQIAPCTSTSDMR